MSGFEILFEDEFFVAAAKPAGMPTQATLDKNRSHFFGELQKQFPYLALHHRLDRDTSGVMLFAKQKEANIPLGEMFQKHHIQKTYLCLTAKKPGPAAFKMKNYLIERQKSRQDKARMIAVSSGGQLAETDFEVLSSMTHGTLVQARPRTGRMHQIRVHLSSRGLGIFGDDLYASPQEPKAPRLMLHAYSLEFTHPFTQASIRIESTLPPDFIEFQARLK